MNVCFYLAVETRLCGVLTHSLNRLCDGNHFLVDVNLLCSQCVGDLRRGNGTEDFAVFVSLYGQRDYGLCQLSSQCLSVCQQLSLLVSLLLQVLCQLLAVALVSDNGNLVRQQVVAAIAVAYFYNIVLETEVCKVLNQNNFHDVFRFLGFNTSLISSYRLHRAAMPSGVLSSLPEPPCADTSGSFP